ncbi:MAG TPA: RNA 2',3'-cyclic phosphodiesterase [Lysobacter sp.]|jgi:2'-5' RNA ligase|nr:RNA 2',3'-cyclic phosphodiesterase [Lysobacter sp.]
MQTDLFSTPPSGGGGIAHNLFFGLMPDDGTSKRMSAAVERLRSQHAPHGRWLKSHRYHMTLHFLGSFQPLREDLVANACKAAAGVRSPAFDLVLNQAGSFPRNRVGWLGCAQTDASLQHLWEGLRQALAQKHVKVDGASQFKPHVTVLRDAKDALPLQPIEPIVWPVRQFVLVDSQLGSRNVYEPLGSWPLG